MRADPGLDVIGCKLGIGIFCGARGDVDYAERRDELFDRNFINRMAIGREVHRRIDMGSGVFIDGEMFEVETVFGKIEFLSFRKARHAKKKVGNSAESVWVISTGPPWEAARAGALTVEPMAAAAPRPWRRL